MKSLTNAQILYAARRARWEDEKPWWFTKAWKARVPKKLLIAQGQETPRTGIAKTLAEMLLAWGDTVTSFFVLVQLLGASSPS